MSFYNRRKKSVNELMLTECMHEGILSTRVDSGDLLSDLKVLMKDYYIATFVEDGQALKIAFNNGQEFDIIVKART